MEHRLTTDRSRGALLGLALAACALFGGCKPPAASEGPGPQTGSAAPLPPPGPSPQVQVPTASSPHVPPPAASEPAPPTAPTMANVPPDLAALAQEYRTLRAIKGKFSGGDWNDAVDRAGGRKEAVMSELGKRLGDGTWTVAEIDALMGPPDAVHARGQGMFGVAYRGRDARVTQIRIYSWRGMRDFLFFASDGAKALSSGWWNAFE